MLRIQAVRSILFDDVAGLRSDSARPDEPIAVLRRARRRALVVALLDWAAIVALFLLRDGRSPFLAAGASEQGLFTLGILAVASHAGFRLGQMEKYAAVARALEELPEGGGARDASNSDA